MHVRMMTSSLHVAHLASLVLQLTAAEQSMFHSKIQDMCVRCVMATAGADTCAGVGVLSAVSML